MKYDHLGYGISNGHWIRKPQVQGEKYIVYVGDHPHDPDGESQFIDTFNDESSAISMTIHLYRKFLTSELKRIT